MLHFKMINFTLSLLIVNVLFSSNICDGAAIEEFNDSRFVVDGVIRQLFELFRTVIRNGNEEKEIPVYDPFVFDKILSDLSTDMFAAEVLITNGTITGFGNYQLEQFNFTKSDLTIELKMDFPLLIFESEHYDLYGNVFDILPLAGRGYIYIEMRDIMLWGKVFLKPSFDYESILIDKMENIHFKIDRVLTRTQFDSNIDDVINTMVNDLLGDYLSKFSSYISSLYNEKVTDFLNTILNKLESWSIFSVIL